MTKIDTSGWKEFVFGDLFTFASIKQAKSQLLIPTVDDSRDVSAIPYVVQSRFNNMVSRYVDRQWLIEHNEPPVAGNCLVLGVTLNACSYQAEEFGASQVITARADGLNPTNGLFISSVIGKFIERFDYKEKPGLEKYKALLIRLPATSSGEPDWDYMERYMSEVMQGSEASLEALRRADSSKHKVDTSGWKEFSLKSLGFDNYHGSRLNKAKRLDGEIPFLTAGKENQGLATYISNKISVYHNPITVDMFGNCFYHPFDCGGDDNVYFFVNNKLTDNTKLFIAASINAITSKKFAYVEQFRQPNADELAVALPATSSGEPDWDYMEQYMSEVMQGSEASLESLCKSIVEKECVR